MRLGWRDWIRVSLYAAAGLLIIGIFLVAQFPLQILLKRCLDYAMSPFAVLGAVWYENLYSGGFVFASAMLPLACSVFFILAVGPSKDRISRSSLWLLLCLVSLFAAVFFVASRELALFERGQMIFKILFVRVLPLAWCLTWSIDVVRRRKLAGGKP